MSIKEDILKFCEDFHRKYSIYPKVIYEQNKNFSKPISIEEVVNIIDELLRSVYKDDSYTLKLRVRLQPFVTYKQVCYKILYEMGYPLQLIADYFQVVSSTVLWGKNRMVDNLMYKDQLTLSIYTAIKEKIEEVNKTNNSIIEINTHESKQIR